MHAMNALILSCGTGGGHDAAARAIQEAFLRRGDHATLLNPYTLCGENVARLIDQTYIRIAQKTPLLFGAIYGVGNQYRRLPWHSPVYLCNKKAVPALEGYLRRHPADVILCTHVFPAEILTHMRDQGMTVPPFFFVATDYTCIPFTEETRCDAYVIPTASHVQEFTRRGVPASKLHPLGIPTMAAFRAAMTQQEAKAQLGLDAGKRYILLCGGSMGSGNLVRIAQSLAQAQQPDTRLIVVCGSNAALYARLQEAKDERIHPLQKTTQMPLYLRACDLYMTKPGGLSSTEAAVTGKPLIHLPPIPGCETRNASFFAQNGMSIPFQSIPQVLALLDDQAAQQRMVNAQRKLIPADAADRIADLAHQL